MKLGSPPQVRGKLYITHSPHLCQRITPAGAGKTQYITSKCFTPHGSPPQVRGKPLEIVLYLAHAGITPAGAGKTCKRRRQIFIRKDHPRRCGENRVAAVLSAATHGSPPQVRGKHLLWTSFSREVGITPAGAGKTYHRGF